MLRCCMEKKFTIYEKPFSINQMYCSGRNMKTQAAREWTEMIIFALNTPEILNSLKQLREFFKLEKHEYELYLKAVYPKEIYYNKNGTISSKTIDTTNWEKNLQDILCDPKYFEDKLDNLNINDKYFTKLISEKRSGDTYKIEITIRIVNRD